MYKLTQKEIRNYDAIDITYKTTKECYELNDKILVKKLFYSAGIYGVNGLIFEDMKTGEQYKITSRTNALFIFN